MRQKNPTEFDEEAVRQVTEYIIAIRNRGPALPYKDHELIIQWTRICPHTQHLLLVLDDILPELYLNTSPSKKPPSLKMVQKKVEKNIRIFQTAT